MTAIVWLEVRKALVTSFRDTIILKIALARLLNKLLREKGKIEKERERERARNQHGRAGEIKK